MRPVVQSLSEERICHPQNYTGAAEREGGREREEREGEGGEGGRIRKSEKEERGGKEGGN